MKKKSSLLVLLLVLSHSFVCSMFTIGKEGKTQKKSKKRLRVNVKPCKKEKDPWGFAHGNNAPGTPDGSSPSFDFQSSEKENDFRQRGNNKFDFGGTSSNKAKESDENKDKFGVNQNFDFSGGSDKRSKTKTWKQDKNSGFFGKFGQNNWSNQKNMRNSSVRNVRGYNFYMQRKETRWQRAQRKKIEAYLKWQQREEQAASLYYLFLRFSSTSATFQDKCVATSFLLGLRVTGTENLIKSGLFDSTLCKFIEMCLYEAINVPLPGPTVTAFIDTIAGIMKKNLNEMLGLFNRGLKREVFSLLAAFDLYWFDIRDLMNMGVKPEYFDNIATDMQKIDAILENKKYMPTFLKLGFKGQELIDSIEDLKEYHEELEELRQDGNQGAQIKKEVFMEILYMKLRPYGSELARGFSDKGKSLLRERRGKNSWNSQVNYFSQEKSIDHDLSEIIDFSEKENKNFDSTRQEGRDRVASKEKEDDFEIWVSQMGDNPKEIPEHMVIAKPPVPGLSSEEILRPFDSAQDQDDREKEKEKKKKKKRKRKKKIKLMGVN